DLTGKALEMSATAYYAYDAPPLFVAQPGDPDLDHEPEEEEQDKAAVDQLAGGLNNLELPTPTTVNQVAVGVGALTLEDPPPHPGGAAGGGDGGWVAGDPPPAFPPAAKTPPPVYQRQQQQQYQQQQQQYLI
ncbi:hypothetical protein BGX29_011046, partial [Mortierella sp. GBA35]